MEWTDKQPTDNGFYWARAERRLTVDKTVTFIEPVEVTDIDSEDPSVMSIACDFGEPLSAYTHWYGPIYPPEFTGVEEDE